MLKKNYLLPSLDLSHSFSQVLAFVYHRVSGCGGAGQRFMCNGVRIRKHFSACNVRIKIAVSQCSTSRQAIQKEVAMGYRSDSFVNSLTCCWGALLLGQTACHLYISFTTWTLFLLVFVVLLCRQWTQPSTDLVHSPLSWFLVIFCLTLCVVVVLTIRDGSSATRTVTHGSTTTTGRLFLQQGSSMLAPIVYSSKQVYFVFAVC